MIGYVTQVDLDDAHENPERVKGKRVPVQVESIFNYKGHNFIIHKPHYGDKNRGYLGTHSKLGFVASNKIDGTPKTTAGKINTCKNPTIYKTVDEVERVIKLNIDRYIGSGYNFDELIDRLTKTMQVQPSLGYIDLKLKNIIK